MTKKITLIWLLSLLSGSLWGQMYYDDGRLIYAGDSTVQGSYQALGINPANLGRVQSFRMGGGVLQFGGNFHSEGLNLTQLVSLGFSDRAFDGTLRDQLLQQNAAPSETFGVDGNFDMNWGAYSVAGPQLGGIAVSLQDRVAGSASIPNPFFGVLLQGQDADALQGVPNPDSLRSLGDGTRANFSHIRSLRVGYGRKLITLLDSGITLYAGATFQRLWGIGYYQADIEAGRFTSLAAFSDAYRINYNNVNLQDPNDQRRLLSSSGRGWALDLGVSADIGDKINVGLAVIDMGSLTWDDNLVAAEADFDAILDSLQTSLINSYGLNQEVGNIYDLVEESAGESFRTALNTQVRMDASYRVSRRIVLGADLVIPFRNGSERVVDRDAGVLTATASWTIIPRVVNFGTGLIYSPSFGYRWPAGLTVGFGRAALSITTADFLTFLTSRDPLASLSVAFITGLHGH